MLSELLDFEYGYFWLILGIILTIMEAMGAMFALASLGIGAMLTAVVAFLGWLTLPWLLGVFAVASLAVFALSRPLVNRITASGAHVKTNVEAMVGRTGVVTQPVGDRSSPGYVKVGGDEWRAVPVDDKPVAVGTKVVIRQVEGATLHVAVEEKPHGKEEES